MCLQPLKIKNTNYGSNNPLTLVLNKDTTHAYMEVPCGHCEQCVAARQNSFVQRIQAESRYNHLFFATLTYDNEHLPKISIDVPVVRPHDAQLELQFDSSQHHKPTHKNNELLHGLEEAQFDSSGTTTDQSHASSHGDSTSRFDEPVSEQLESLVPIEVVDSNEFLSLAAFDLPENDDPEYLSGEGLPEDELDYESITFAYADIHDVQLLLKNVRDNLGNYNRLSGRCLRYAAVSELGKQNGRPHFHILFLLEHRPEDFDPNGKPIRSVLLSLEAQLRTCVRKYWAENVGTRKNPIYYPRFKYARKWSFGKVYTNFDLHWVDPSLTRDQTANVGYYVSKYMMKGSDRDSRRQQFLRLNLTEDEYQAVWKVIRCRMTCSKGLGLDARFETIEHKHEVVNYKPLHDVAAEMDAYLATCDDLPDFSEITLIKSRQIKVIKKRVMIPNFELANKIRKELKDDVGVAPGPVFIDPTGKHRPLSHYYQRFGFIYTVKDAVEIVTQYRGPEKEPPTKEDADEAQKRLVKRRKIADSHSEFDNVSTIDMPTDDPSLTQYIY